MKRLRTDNQNKRFHAMLGDWAGASGQDASVLKRRVKDHLHAYSDIDLPNDARTDELLRAFSMILRALGKHDMMWILPESRCVRFYHTSAKWSPEKMQQAIDTVCLMAGEEGVSLDHGNWQDA